MKSDENRSRCSPDSGKTVYGKEMVDRFAPEWWNFIADGGSLLKERAKLAGKTMEVRNSGR